MSKGLFEILPKILNSKFEKIFEQGAWAVGNISADEGSFKETMLKYNVLDPLAAKILTTNDPEILKYSNWALCNLVFGTSKNLKKRIALTALIKIVMTQNDLDMLAESFKAILDLTDESIIQILIDSRVVNRIFELINPNNKVILYTLLQILSFVTNGTDRETQVIIDCGGVETIFQLLDDPGLEQLCRRECLWIISNILVGTFDQMKFVFNNPRWVDSIFRHCTHENQKVKREAIWCICNSTKNGDLSHIKLLVDKGILKLFYLNLDMQMESNMLKTILEGINHILRWGIPENKDEPNGFQAYFENEGLIDRLEQLQYHPTLAVYQYVSNIIETYFKVHDPI